MESSFKMDSSAQIAFPHLFLKVGGYFPFSYLENGSIKNARSLGVRAASGKPKWSL
jgi:hypothetical protein